MISCVCVQPARNTCWGKTRTRDKTTIRRHECKFTQTARTVKPRTTQHNTNTNSNNTVTIYRPIVTVCNNVVGLGGGYRG